MGRRKHIDKEEEARKVTLQQFLEDLTSDFESLWAIAYDVGYEKGQEDGCKIAKE